MIAKDNDHHLYALIVTMAFRDDRDRDRDTLTFTRTGGGVALVVLKFSS